MSTFAMGIAGAVLATMQLGSCRLDVVPNENPRDRASRCRSPTTAVRRRAWRWGSAPARSSARTRASSRSATPARRRDLHHPGPPRGHGLRAAIDERRHAGELEFRVVGGELVGRWRYGASGAWRAWRFAPNTRPLPAGLVERFGERTTFLPHP